MQTQRPVITARPGIVPLSASRSAVFFDTDPLTSSTGQRLTAALDGCPVDGPIAVTRLSLSNGGQRHVLIMSHSADKLCRRALTLRGHDAILAATDPDALQSPLVDPIGLLAGLDRPGSLRLLKLFLTTGASLFGNGVIGDFSALVDQLVERLGTHVPLAARSPVGRNAWVLSWRLPGDLELPPLRAVTLRAGGRTQRVTEFTLTEEIVDGCRLLHLMVSRPLPQDGEFLALGEALLCLGMNRTVAARPLASWLVKRSAAAQADVLAFVERLSSEQPDVGILRDELSCPPDAEPVATVLHLSRSAEGLLYMIGVDDPRRLLSAVRLQMQHVHVDFPCDRLEWHSRHGPVAVGVAPVASGIGAATLAPLYRSGRLGAALSTIVAPAEDLLPDVFRGLPPNVAAEPLARVLPAAMGARPVWRHRLTEFGRIPLAPKRAVVIAAEAAPEYLHTVVASVIAEAGGPTVEIVLHHRDGPATEVVRNVAEMLSAVHRVGLRVVSMAPQALPSECLRAALESVRAPKVVALGPSTLPGDRGWLPALRRHVAASSDARVVRAEPRHQGAGDGGYVLGLNPAAVACLRDSRPILPSVLADLRATTGLAVTVTKGVGFTSYDDSVPDELARAVETLVADRNTEAHHV